MKLRQRRELQIQKQNHMLMRMAGTLSTTLLPNIKNSRHFFLCANTPMITPHYSFLVLILLCHTTQLLLVLISNTLLPPSKHSLFCSSGLEETPQGVLTHEQEQQILSENASRQLEEILSDLPPKIVEEVKKKQKKRGWDLIIHKLL